MSEAEIRMVRMLNQAYALACGVAQDVQTQAVCVFPARGRSVTFVDVGDARRWLRQYAVCGLAARRCFHEGCFVQGPARVISAR